MQETPTPPTEAAAKDEEPGGKKTKTMYKWQDDRPPIQLLACSPSGHLAAVSVQGTTSLVLLALPSLERCAAALPLPCAPLAVSFVDDQRLYVTLEAPAYMAAYVVTDNGARVEEDTEDPVVKSVRAYGVQHALPTQVSWPSVAPGGPVCLGWRSRLYTALITGSCGQSMFLSSA
jgi:hypothetical protein